MCVDCCEGPRRQNLVTFFFWIAGQRPLDSVLSFLHNPSSGAAPLSSSHSKAFSLNDRESPVVRSSPLEGSFAMSHLVESLCSQAIVNIMLSHNGRLHWGKAGMDEFGRCFRGAEQWGKAWCDFGCAVQVSSMLCSSLGRLVLLALGQLQRCWLCTTLYGCAGYVTYEFGTSLGQGYLSAPKPALKMLACLQRFIIRSEDKVCSFSGIPE